SFPEIALLPKNLQQRALIRAFSLNIACDMHPLNNLRVLQYLSNTLQVSDEQKNQWYRNWSMTGFRSLETQLEESNGQFCFGDQPTIADCCLNPQLYRTFRLNIERLFLPKMHSINSLGNSFQAFQKAAPVMQP